MYRLKVSEDVWEGPVEGVVSRSGRRATGGEGVVRGGFSLRRGGLGDSGLTGCRPQGGRDLLQWTRGTGPRPSTVRTGGALNPQGRVPRFWYRTPRVESAEEELEELPGKQLWRRKHLLHRAPPPERPQVHRLLVLQLHPEEERVKRPSHSPTALGPTRPSPAPPDVTKTPRSPPPLWPLPLGVPLCGRL